MVGDEIALDKDIRGWCSGTLRQIQSLVEFGKNTILQARRMQ